MPDKGPSLVYLELRADVAKAVQGLLRVADAEKKVVGGLKDAKTHTPAIIRDMEGMATAASKLLPILGIGGGVLGGITAIKAAVQDWDRYMSNIAKSAGTLQRESMIFSALMPPGDITARKREGALLGAQYGVSPKDALDALQSMYSLYNMNWPAALSMLPHLALAERFKLPMQGGMDISAAIVRKGLPGWWGPNLTVQAGRASHRDPELLASAAEALPTFEDPVLAFALMTHIMGGAAAPQQAATYAKRTGQALQSGTGKLGKLFRTLHVAEGTQEEKLMALYHHLMKKGGQIRPREMDILGFTEYREQMGVAAGIRGMGQMADIIVEGIPVSLKTVPDMMAEFTANLYPGYLADLTRSVLDADPGSKVAFLQRQAQMMEEVTRDLGPGAVRAQARDIALRREAAVIRALPIGGKITEAFKSKMVRDDGLPTWWGRISGIGRTKESEREYLENLYMAQEETQEERIRLAQAWGVQEDWGLYEPRPGRKVATNLAVTNILAKTDGLGMNRLLKARERILWETGMMVTRPEFSESILPAGLRMRSVSRAGIIPPFTGILGGQPVPGGRDQRSDFFSAQIVELLANIAGNVKGQREDNSLTSTGE